MEPTPATELTSSQLYNFKLTLTYDSRGNISDIEEFKKKLVSTLKAPLTSAEYDAGKKQQPINAIKVFVSFDAQKKPTHAAFRKQNAKGTSAEYVARDVNGEVHLVGKPPITPTQENALFLALAKETYAASPFDSITDGKNIHNAAAELAPELKLKKKK